MAGTRLWIQLSVTLELVLLTLLAGYAGFCGIQNLNNDSSNDAHASPADILCVPLFSRHARRSLERFSSDVLRQEEEQEEEETVDSAIRFTPLVVAVSSPAQQRQWQAEFDSKNSWDEPIRASTWNVIVVEDHILKSVCQNPEKEDKMETAPSHVALWICPFVPKNANALRMIVTQSSGTALLYPTNKDQVSNMVDLLYPASTKRSLAQRHKLKVTLVVHPGGEWRKWANVVDQWLDRESQQWPVWCLDNDVETEIQFTDALSKKARSKSESRRDDNNSNTTTVYHSVLASNQVRDWLDEVSPIHTTVQSPSVGVVIYVSESEPLLIQSTGKQQQHSSILSTDHHLFISVGTNQNDDSALIPILPALQRLLCLGDNANLHVEPSGAVPMWQVHGWIRRLLRTAHERARRNARRVREELLNSAWSVAISDEVVGRWQRSVHLIEQAETLVMQEDYSVALEMLEESISISLSLQSDPSLMEPLEFPVDQYMAIFAPLLFPLLVPFLAGLVREVKRYKRLKEKKKSAQVVG